MLLLLYYYLSLEDYNIKLMFILSEVYVNVKRVFFVNIRKNPLNNCFWDSIQHIHEYSNNLQEILHLHIKGTFLFFKL